MSFRMCTLASGSEGNACYAECDGVRLLIDAGISYRQLCQFLHELGTDPAALQAVLLTHEHFDHIGGLSVLMRKHNLPIFATAGTFEGLSELKLFENLPKSGFHLIRSGESFEIGPLQITSVPISHDAKEPVAYRLDAPDWHFAVVTDLGVYTDQLIRQMQGLNALLLEANHNPAMLETGPYPYPLKIRIQGERGHLSNEAAAGFLKAVCHPGLKAVLLGHLSRTNNYPLLALETVRRILKEENTSVIPELYIAPPRGLSEILMS
ncbi:MAG: MBL fold metallo-hydrolase [Lachnospiraceae bacterium]|nr:MBL fold metallo-hydrolase [Lachnospiraceae bacterium]